MSLRDTLNKNPLFTTGLTVGIIVVALAAIAFQLSGGSDSSLPSGVFYSNDDGATWFADEIGKPTPFMHQGKEAVQAHVFQCPGKDPFVGYLERMTDRSRQRAERARAEGRDASAMPDEMETLVKAPGANKKWVPRMDFPRSEPIMTIKCEDGAPAKELLPR